MEDVGANVREWTDVVRRARLGRTTKLVALLLANYADANGTRIYPGVARLAIEAELSYKIVQASLSALRTAGLIEVVRHGTRRGQADHYRLILGVDLMERVEVLAPAQVSKRVEALSEQHRGSRDSVHPTGEGAPESECTPAEGLHGVDGAPHFSDSNGSVHPTASTRCTPRRTPLPTKTVTQLLPTTPTAEVVEPVAVRARDPSNSLPSTCSHGLKSRQRSDGTPTCALCRRSSPGPPTNVIPLRRPA